MRKTEGQRDKLGLPLISYTQYNRLEPHDMGIPGMFEDDRSDSS